MDQARSYRGFVFGLAIGLAAMLGMAASNTRQIVTPRYSINLAGNGWVAQVDHETNTAYYYVAVAPNNHREMVLRWKYDLTQMGKETVFQQEFNAPPPSNSEVPKFPENPLPPKPVDDSLPPKPVMFSAITDNPYSKAVVGDSITQRIYNSSMSPGNQFSETKMTVTARTSDSVTLTTIVTQGGVSGPPMPMMINLKEKYDPKGGFPTEKYGGVVKKIGEGKEKLTVSDITYECDWYEHEISSGKDGDPKSKIKVWINESAPLDGILKREMEMRGNQITMNAIAIERGK